MSLRFVKVARRKPVQERSKRRYAAILDAAAVLFSTSGYDATSMEAIAQRAGTSIGSVYQFFSNKQEVFIALGERCIERVRALFAVELGPEALARPLSELVDTAVQAFIELSHNDPDLQALNVNLHMYSLVESMDQVLLRDLADGIGQLVSFYAPDVPDEQRRAIGDTVVQTVNAFLFFSHRTGKKELDANLQEVKRMLTAYLGSYLPPSP